MQVGRYFPHQFALSLSKGCPSSWNLERKEQGFDKLSPNGFCTQI